MCGHLERFRAKNNVPVYGHLCASCWRQRPEEEREGYFLLFRPSEIVLAQPIPLVDTFRSSEREAAATVLVRACDRLGDEWQFISHDDFLRTLQHDRAESREPICYLTHNPFWYPDLVALVDAGYAMKTGERYCFTDIGYRALSKWVRP